MNDKEAKLFIERAEKMVEKLTKSLQENEDEEVTGALMLFVAAKFSAGILLAIQEKTCQFNVEDEYLEIVKSLMRDMGKDMKIQSLKDKHEQLEKEHDEIDRKIKEKEKEIEERNRKIEMLEHERDLIKTLIGDDTVN